MKISNIWLIFFNELFVVARSVLFDSHSPLIAIRSQHLFFIKKHYNFSKLFLNHAWRYHQCLMIPVLCHYLAAHGEYAYFFIMFVQIWKFSVCFHLGISIPFSSSLILRQNFCQIAQFSSSHPGKSLLATHLIISSHHNSCDELKVTIWNLKYFSFLPSLLVQPYQLNSISFLRLVIFQTHCGDSRLFCFFLFHCNGLESPLHKCFMISHIF